MRLFNKKETITQNIAYMAIMAAINVIFVLIAYFVPFLLFILVFFLPLTSTMVTMLCKKKYLPIYVIATIGLCLLTTMRDFSDTLFYVIPSIFSGIVFGLCIEKKVPSSISIFISITINIGFTYAFIPCINFLYKTDIIEVFASIFNLKDFKYLDFIVPAFIFLISLIQALLTFIVIKIELPKMGFITNDSINNLYLSISGLFFAILTIIFSLFYPCLSLLFSLCIFYFFAYSIVEIISNKKKSEIITLIVMLCVTIVIYITTYSYITQPLSFLLINILPVSCFIIFSIIEIIKREKHCEKNYIN